MTGSNGLSAAEGDVCVGLQNIFVAIASAGEFGIQTQLLDEPIGPGNNYTLHVRTGNPSHYLADTPGAVTLLLGGFPGYRIELVDEDGIVLAADDNSEPPDDDSWTYCVVRFAAPLANPCIIANGSAYDCIGKDLRVRLLNLNGHMAQEANTVYFDDVRLEVVVADDVRLVDSSQLTMSGSDASFSSFTCSSDYIGVGCATSNGVLARNVAVEFVSVFHLLLLSSVCLFLFAVRS